ncbi:MAG: NDP-sugar synthase [Candidatus Margulisbacteria bacterium]|nr:NDP-sugar synthase [Candidatus Margulisiibacteriota bacterium]
MKALILAAGYGTRLEPLTLAVPKPMIPILNLPTMQHNIELLKKHGFKDIIANIHYHPEQIENYFGDGYAFDVNLAYSYEEKLLGTAGGVKRMARDFNGVKEPFIVLSSDALTDINLNRLVEFHKSKKALVTIALAKVADVRQFGVAIQDENGRITGFQEKPQAEEALSDLANAGIYVFEPEILKLIPEGFYDFGRELFPKLVQEQAPIYGYRMVEYWNDVGGVEKYIQSNYDAMKGAVQIQIPGKKVSSSTWIGAREKIDPTARFEGSVIIGDRCSIGQDVYIKDAVIGDKCAIEARSIITGSVIWSDTAVGKDAEINRSVVGNWCHIGANAHIFEGSIISNRSVVRIGGEVPPNSRLQPNSIV